MKEEMLCYCSVCHMNQYFKKISIAATTRKHVRAQYQCEKCGNKNIYEFPVK